MLKDARGLAHLVRSGWYRPVHVKSVQSYKLRPLLGHRLTLKRNLRDIENEIRHALKVFGPAGGTAGAAGLIRGADSRAGGARLGCGVKKSSKV
jgi:transposase